MTHLRDGSSFVFEGSLKYSSSLKSKVLSSSYLSIKPHELFAYVLDLADGRIEEAFLLTWNFLSAGNRSRIIQRNTSETALRLFDITGEQRLLSEPVDSRSMVHALSGHSVQNYIDLRGDNYRAWYHFFGTALHAYRLQFYSSASGISTRKALWIEHNLVSTGTLYSKKQASIDEQGIAFGEQLAKLQKVRRIIGKRTYLYDNFKEYGSRWATNKENQNSKAISDMEKVLIMVKALSRGETENEDVDYNSMFVA